MAKSWNGRTGVFMVGYSPGRTGMWPGLNWPAGLEFCSCKGTADERCGLAVAWLWLQTSLPVTPLLLSSLLRLLGDHVLTQLFLFNQCSSALYFFTFLKILYKSYRAPHQMLLGYKA